MVVGADGLGEPRLMSKSFSSIGAFTAFLAQRIATLPAAQKRALGEASKVVLEEARSLPGHYQAGWPALQTETIARKSAGDTPCSRPARCGTRTAPRSLARTGPSSGRMIRRRSGKNSERRGGFRRVPC